MQFKHRTGQWKVAAADQRNGWNYIRVKHDKGGGSVVTTNYVEWVNDNDSNALAASGNSLAFTGAGSLDLSGVQYYTSGQGRYQVNVDNAYKYVYGHIAHLAAVFTFSQPFVAGESSSQTNPG